MQPQRSSDLIDKSFNLADLTALCDQLRVDYEDLPGGDTRTAKVRALFEHLFSRGRLLALFEAVERERPHLDLSPCFHELIAQQFNGDAAMQKLFDALGLPLRHFQEPERHAWGSPVWTRDKAEKLQTYFYNRGEWARLRQIVAAESARTRLPLALATLERLFPANY